MFRTDAHLSRLPAAVVGQVAGPPKLSRNWEQARRTFPVCFWMLQCRHASVPMTPNEDRFGCVEMYPTNEMLRAAALFRSAIDEGRPLLAELARILRVPRWVIRHLEHSGIPAVSPKYYQDRMDLPHDLARLTPELAPATRGEYSTMYYTFRYLARSVMARWLRQPLAIADQRAIGRYIRSEPTPAAMYEYNWFLADVVTLLGYPQVWRGQLYRALGGPSIAEWFVLLGRFEHLRRGGLAQRVTGEEDSEHSGADASGEWPPLIPEWAHLDGLDFYPLHTTQELESEGRELSHCVADYAWRCAQGRSHIFTARRRGVSVATLEIVPRQRDGKLVWKLRQAKGAGNEPLAPDTSEAVKRFMEQLNEGAISVTAAVSDELHGRVSTLPPDKPGIADVDTGDDLARPLLELANEQGLDAADLLRPALELQPGRGHLLADFRRALKDTGSVRSLRVSRRPDHSEIVDRILGA